MPRPHLFHYKFVCFACDYYTYASGNIRRHIRSHLGEKPFQCSRCSFSSGRTDSLKVHLKTIHDITTLYLECRGCEDKEPILGFDNSSMRNIVKHCKSCPKLPRFDPSRPYSCLRCSYSCTRAYNMIQHLRRHIGKTFYCATCSKKFTTMFSLKMHLKSHTGNNYECPLCKQKENSKPELYEHYVKRHGVDKSYTVALRTPTHTVQILGAKTKRSSEYEVVYLKASNTSTSSDISDPELFQICTHCRQQLAREVDILFEHTKVCKAAFSENSIICCHCQLMLPLDVDLLFDHCKSCAGALRSDPFRYKYVCCKCRIFNTYNGGNMKQHILHHLGEKPYKCDLCSYRSSRKGNVKVHYNRLHKNQIQTMF
ncbi:zinc finger protein 569-like [Diaphorina citri]|uniref:Zinc finger protein 569-like n=1 Tax=Diaphorina citri TaxID=121845 RepID=A0A3Q0JA93_DIACI|nr:zinc finger protein 569-like [Diaphorina citri]